MYLYIVPYLHVSRSTCTCTLQKEVHCNGKKSAPTYRHRPSPPGAKAQYIYKWYYMHICTWCSSKVSTCTFQPDLHTRSQISPGEDLPTYGTCRSSLAGWGKFDKKQRNNNCFYMSFFMMLDLHVETIAHGLMVEPPSTQCQGNFCDCTPLR